MMSNRFAALCGAVALGLPAAAHADENLFGYKTGAETLPKGSTHI